MILLPLQAYPQAGVDNSSARADQMSAGYLVSRLWALPAYLPERRARSDEALGGLADREGFTCN